MNENMFLEKMKDLTDNDSLTMATALNDMEEWDSVSVLGYVSIALDCGKKITADQIRNCGTIADLYSLLQQ